MFLLQEMPLHKSFCRIGIGGRIPSRSSVAEGIKAISSETWDKINIMLVRYASEGKNREWSLQINNRLLKGGKQFQIHSTQRKEVRGSGCRLSAGIWVSLDNPKDSVLLYDSIRVLCKIMDQIGYTGYHDRTRSAKRRMNEIRCSRSRRKRRGRYEKLMRITREVIGYAQAPAAIRSETGKARRTLRHLRGSVCIAGYATLKSLLPTRKEAH